MRFFKQRRHRPMIPVLSLIDILAILLIFFVVTATFKEDSEVVVEEQTDRQERRIDVALPTVESIEGAPVMDERLRITVQDDGRVFLGDDEVVGGAVGLAPLLVEARSVNPAATFEMMADEQVPLGVVIGVLDAVDRAGVPVGDVPARILRQEAGP